jgi:hypothetical protein
MQTRLAILSAVLLGGAFLGPLGCRAIKPKSPFHGSIRCSCSSTGCECSHCRGVQEDCDCRGVDALGSSQSVGTDDRDQH